MKSNLICEFTAQLKGGNALSKVYADEQLKLAYEQYGKAVEKYCRIRLGETADMTNDCVQEAFCVYYKRLLKGETFENSRAFLYRTANIMVCRAKEEYFKNAKRTKPLEDAENIAVFMQDAVPDELDYDVIKARLISKLSDGEQQLYQMKYVDGKSLKEIGKILDIAPAAVANRTSRLRTKIKGLVESVLKEAQKGGS